MPEPNTPVPCDEHQQRIMPEEASEPNKPVPYAEYQQRTMPNTYGEEASEPNTPAPYAGYQQRTMPNTYGKEASEPNKPVPYAGYQQRTMPNAYEEEASEPNKPVPYAGYQQRAMPNTYRKEAAPYRKNSDAMQWASFNWADEMALQNRHAQTVGSRGPVLEQDSILHEALQIFINKKIPERPVHTKGFGAFGFFQTVNSMREFTTLPFLQSPGQQVPVMVRFSFAVSTKGTPDTSRNVRGFSTKFYAREGVFDLLCNHIPVLFVRDGIRFPEAITSLMPSPTNNLPDPEQFWAFVSRAPEAIHFVMWLYSDVGTVKSFRHIQGHSVNTYVWRNARGVRRYVKIGRAHV
jgi:catalase